MTTTKDRYTGRVTGRTALARELQQPKWAPAIAEAGLVAADLAFVVTKGEAAEGYDRQQRDQLARQRQDVTSVLAAREQIELEEEHLRNRLPAVVADLAADPASAPVGRWLAAVVFERYRIRVTTEPLPPDAPPDNRPAELRARVLRRDRLSWAQTLAQFTQALLDPARAAVAEQLGARGFARDRLERLARGAEDLVGKLGGKAPLTPVEATRLEADAVHDQKTRWHACLRMIRRVVSEHPELSALWAAC